jgi:uncharacterized membrane protein
MSEPDRQQPDGPVTRQTPVVSNYGLVLTVYILYLVGFLTGIIVLVGVVIAYLLRDKTGRVSQSPHQVREGTPCLKHGRADTQSKLLLVW